MNESYTYFFHTSSTFTLYHCSWLSGGSIPRSFANVVKNCLWLLMFNQCPFFIFVADGETTDAELLEGSLWLGELPSLLLTTKGWFLFSSGVFSIVSFAVGLLICEIDEGRDELLSTLIDEHLHLRWWNCTKSVMNRCVVCCPFSFFARGEGEWKPSTAAERCFDDTREMEEEERSEEVEGRRYKGLRGEVREDLRERVEEQSFMDHCIIQIEEK